MTTEVFQGYVGPFKGPFLQPVYSGVDMSNEFHYILYPDSIGERKSGLPGAG
jgi:hypothetical protein